MKYVFGIVGDLHSNSTIGLSPPVVNLDDGGTYRASKSQLWLWENWIHFWQVELSQTISLIKPDKVVLIFGGDLVDGDHHETSQIITRNMYTQHKIALDILEIPLSIQHDEIYIIRGTPSHVGKSGQWEEFIAKDIEAVSDKENGTCSFYHLRKNFDGFRLDVAHHGKSGYKPWTRSNAVNSLAAQIVYDYAKNNFKLPHLALRFHTHQMDESSISHPVKVIQCPAWQLKTEFVHKVAPESILADIGGVIVITENEKFHSRIVSYKPKEFNPWK